MISFAYRTSQASSRAGSVRYTCMHKICKLHPLTINNFITFKFKEFMQLLYEFFMKFSITVLVFSAHFSKVDSHSIPFHYDIVGNFLVTIYIRSKYHKHISISMYSYMH